MLQIAICDDEKYYRKTIRLLLTEYLEKRGLEYTFSIFLSGEEFLSLPENAVKFDVVFMDINMSRVDGIETAAWMRFLHSETEIVFVTAFIHYTPEGYKVDAVRFIMKDTLEAALPECMDAVLKRKRLEQVEFSCVEGNVRLFTDRILYVAVSYTHLLFDGIMRDAETIAVWMTQRWHRDEGEGKHAAG